jgi:RNA polymerase sigma-70 factor (ECF subfamily)
MTPMLKLRMRSREAAPMEQALAHADALYHLARYLTSDATEAEDLVQETYARALRTWDDFAPGTNVKAWLFRILRNQVISRYRQDARRPPPGPYDTTEAGADDETGELAPVASVEPEGLRRVTSRELEAALRTLSDDARTVVLLDLEGFTETELAAVLGCAVGTVKSRLHRARAALRVQLTDRATRDQP